MTHRFRTFLALLFLALYALPVSAQPGSQNPGGGAQGSANPASTGGGLQNPLNNINTLQDFLNAILRGVVEIGTIILILALVYTGFLFVAARGNSEKLQSARSALVWTVIGGLILLGAQAIGLVIGDTVNSL